jgi:hypothetical protein
MRRRNPTNESPQTSGELAAIEATLAGQPVEADHAELAELVRALRGARPVLRPEFAGELDARVGSGFAAPPHAGTRHSAADGRAGQADGSVSSRPPFRLGSRRPGGRAARRRHAGLAFGGAATVFIAATALVASGVLDRGDHRADLAQAPTAPRAGATAQRPAGRPPAQGALERGSSSGGAPGTSTGSKAPAVTGPGAGADVVPPSGAIVGLRRDRKVERQASLTLAAAPGDVEDVADDVIKVTDSYRGFVLSSTVASGDARQAGATLDLRIPSLRLQDALRDLSGLAHVRARSQSTQDITVGFVSATRRLRAVLRERRSLLRQLALADTPNETASIRARLVLVNRRIAAARADVRQLRNRVAYSAVSVEIVEDADLGASGSSTLDRALDDAGSILGASLAVAVVTLAVLVPASVLALLGWVAYRGLARRRRERALDL